MAAYGPAYNNLANTRPVHDRPFLLDLRSRWATWLVVQSLWCCSQLVSFTDRH